MTDLDRLKMLIDEEEFPYFEDEYLQLRIDEMDEGQSLKSLARELCIVKAGIEEIKLGDVTIPSPRKHFMLLAHQYRKNMTGVAVRIDGR